MLVKLSSGNFEGEGATLNNGTMLEKRALLVYAGDFLAMTGPVTVTADHIDLLAMRHNSGLAKLKRLVTGEIRLSACPPVQVDHSMSAHDTVGRLVNELEVAPYVNDEGVSVPGLWGTLRILGRENVEKVLDGRWSHLSIGADLDVGVLSEMTITPFPAAANAQMLRHQLGQTTDDNTSGDGKVVKPVETLSEPDLSIKKYLVEVKGMTEEEADAKIAGMSEDEKKALEEEIAADVAKKAEMAAAEEAERVRLAAEAEAQKVQLAAVAADAETKKKAKLAAAKDQLTQLSTDFRSTLESARLAARKGRVLSTLSKLRAHAKITPAEIKKLDLDQLSKASDEAVALALQTYENRQPVILTGQLGSKRGSSAAFAAQEQQKRMSKLEAETRANMSLLRSTTPAKLATSDAEMPGGAPEGSQELTNDGQTDEAFFEREYQAVCQLLDEGKTEELKVRLKGWMQKLAILSAMAEDEPEVESEERDTNAKETEEQLSSIMKDVQTLEGRFGELSALAKTIVETA